MTKSSFTCALSGQPLVGNNDEIVVTPSGKMCFKKLLLSKLADNGGVDPFGDSDTAKPLSEDELIVVSSLPASTQPPRPQGASSLPSLLQLLNTEYESLVLELFDTRKALEEARKELSQALYQNDAAVRVVARLSQERDAARQELQQWEAQGGTPAKKRSAAGGEADADTDGPASKRSKTDAPADPDGDGVPKEQLEIMLDTWKSLAKQRKDNKKKTAAAAPTPATLQTFAKLESKSYHSTKSQGVLHLKALEDSIVTAGKDKTLCVYSKTDKKVVNKWTGVNAKQMDAKGHLVAVVVGNGKTVQVYDTEKDTLLTTLDLDDAAVAIDIHASLQLFAVATSNKIRLYKAQDAELVASFTSESTIACGAMHPDGLIYVVGTTAGKIDLWDFKSGLLAGTLETPGDDVHVTAFQFSANGYHLVTPTDSNVLLVWDLKKQSILKSIETDNKVADVAMDKSGKYLAYAVTGQNKICVTTMKEWGDTATLDCKGKGQIKLDWQEADRFVVCRTTERAVQMWGAPTVKEE